MASSKFVRATSAVVGEPTVEVAERPVPEPREGEALVQVFLRPVNPVDSLSVSKRFPFPPNNDGDVVPGMDAVGRVVKLGAGATSPPVGARVVSNAWVGPLGGTWQQYVTVPAASLDVVPEGIDDVIAAQYNVNPHTVLGIVAQAKKSGLRPGGWLYIDAANSVVGRGLIEVAREENYRVAAVVRRPELVEELKALGAAAVVDASGLSDVAAELPPLVLAATGGERADVAFTAVAGPGAAAAGSVLKDGGIVHPYGSLSGQESYVSDADAERGVRIGEYFLYSNALDALAAEERRALRERVWKALEKKQLVAESVKILPLDKAQEALDAVFVPGRGEKYFLEG